MVLVDSCFVLFGTHQLCLPKICKRQRKTPRANAHKLQNDPIIQVPYFALTRSQKQALPHHVFRGAIRQGVAIGVSKTTSGPSGGDIGEVMIVDVKIM